MKNELSILSYNIWFEAVDDNERLNSLLAHILYNDPDVLCLQEVRPKIYDILIKELVNYKYSYPQNVKYNYGCVIFSKYRISQYLTIPFANSSMGRELLICKIDYPFIEEVEDTSDSYQGIEKIEIMIVNTHFESIFKRNVDNTVKIKQYEQANDILNQLYDQNVKDDYNTIIFCSDTNILNHEEDKFPFTSDKKSEEQVDGYMFIDEEESDTDDSQSSKELWKDAWSIKGTSKNRYTYNGYNNMHLKERNCKYTSRFDRILYRSKICHISNFKLVELIDGFVEPSDHFGIIATFNLSENNKNLI